MKPWKCDRCGKLKPAQSDAPPPDWTKISAEAGSPHVFRLCPTCGKLFGWARVSHATDHV